MNITSSLINIQYHLIMFQFKTNNLDQICVYIVLHVMYSFQKILILLILYSFMAECYVNLESYDALVDYLDENSLVPIIQIYYNHHFSTSRQFQDFISTLQETEYKNKDYSRFVLINCDKIKEGETIPCDEMRRTRDNRKLLAYYPSSEFIKYGGKLLQNPSQSRILNYQRDVVPVSEFERLIQDVMPNFYEEMTNIEDYYEWMRPRHTPKLVFLTREEEIPMVLKKLGVYYFLRFDLAFVSDLSESIVSKMNITSFPRLLAVNYNYEKNTYDIFQYKDSDFSANSYHKIKQFLEPFALKQPRNDLVIQKIKIPMEKQLTTVHKKSELAQFLDNSNGWTIISEGTQEPLKLKALKEKYGRYFEYVHFVNGDQTEILGLYDKDKEQSYGIDDQVKFQPLSKNQFLQASAVWLSKNSVVISVREKYGYLCAIEQSAHFKGLTHCLIIKQSDYEETSAALKIPFEYGFACFESSKAKVNEKIVGRTFKSINFDEVYGTIEYLTKRKSKEVVDDFKAQPVRQIKQTEILSNLCNFPNKQCALLFTHGQKKDRTAFEYLEEIALNFINEYDFYEVDLNCNSHFEDEISNFKNSYGGLMVYNPKKASYVLLKARLSKSTFEKFLKANLRDNKKLPYHPFKDKDIKVNPCTETDKKTERNENDSL